MDSAYAVINSSIGLYNQTRAGVLTTSASGSDIQVQVKSSAIITIPDNTSITLRNIGATADSLYNIRDTSFVAAASLRIIKLSE
jgi:hypothetical protein